MTIDEIKQQKKNEALNKIKFVYSKYFKYDQCWGDEDDESDSCEIQRDNKVKDILYNLEKDLLLLKNK